MKDRKTQVFLLTIFSYFAVGSMVLTANTALKTIIAEYSWSDSQGGLLISFMSMGNLIASVFSGMLIARIGRRNSMIFFGGCMAVSFALFASLPNPTLFYPMLFVAGFAWGGINTLNNTIVSELYDGSSSRLNILHAAYSVGAVVFPLAVGFVIQQGGSWRLPVWAVAILGAAVIVQTLFTPVPERKVAKTSGGKQSAVAFHKELQFYLGVLMFFTYVGVETAACAWLSGYLAQTNEFFQKVPSETMVSLMWLTMIVGRLIFAALGTKLNSRVLLLAQSTGFLLGLVGIIFGSGNTALAIVSVAFMGLSMSAMYALCVSNNNRYMNSSAVAPGVLFAGGGLGAAAVPYLAGLVSDGYGLKTGMISLCFFLVALILIALVNLRINSKRANA